MRSQITENKVASIFNESDEISQEVMSVISEAVPASPESALKNLFTSKNFKGTVSNDDLQIVFKKGSQWDKLFGVDKVKKAFDKMVSDKVIGKAGKAWKWAG